MVEHTIMSHLSGLFSFCLILSMAETQFLKGKERYGTGKSVTSTQRKHLFNAPFTHDSVIIVSNGRTCLQDILASASELLENLEQMFNLYYM